MKRLLLPLLTALALPIAVNAEVTNDYILKANQSKKLFSERKFSEMKNICEELIEISPDNPMGYVCKGVALGFNSKNKKKREAKPFKESLKVGATWRGSRSVRFDHAQTTNPNDTNRKLGYVPIGH